MSDENSILVYTGGVATRSRRSPEELKIDMLVKSVNQFLSKLNEILKNTPKQFDEFRFDEISFSAEISTDGKLVLLGSGVEAGNKGALVFKFKRINTISD